MDDKYKLDEYLDIMRRSGYAETVVKYDRLAIEKLIRFSPELNLEKFDEMLKETYVKTYRRATMRAARKFVLWVKEGLIPVKDKEHVIELERPWRTRWCVYEDEHRHCTYKKGVKLKERLTMKDCKHFKPMPIVGACEEPESEMPLSEEGYEVIYRDSHSIMYGRKNLA